MAARGARAAGRAHAPHRHAAVCGRGRSGVSDLGRSISARAGAIGLDPRSQPANRRPLGQDPRRHSQTCGGIGRARARRHPGPWCRDRRAVAAGDPHRADRVPGFRRSGRRRPGRQSGAARWQRHGLSHFRIQPEWEMAGGAQRDRAKRDAGGGLSGPYPRWRHQPVCRDPGRGTVAQGGV